MNPILISPTGQGIRQKDDFGSGLYNAPRGKEKHNGIDFICTPNQNIYAPISGKIIRVAYPYSDNKIYQGILLENDSISVKFFYFIPDKNLLGKEVKQGEPIGIAQDISKKYNSSTKKMIPHIHLQIDRVDPTVLLG